MTTLLDDVNLLITKRVGDIGRLKHIKEAIENNNSLYDSDREYLDNLIDKHLFSNNSKKKSNVVKPTLKTIVFCNECGNTLDKIGEKCSNCKKTKHQENIESTPSDYSKINHNNQNKFNPSLKQSELGLPARVWEWAIMIIFVYGMGIGELPFIIFSEFIDDGFWEAFVAMVLLLVIVIVFTSIFIILMKHSLSKRYPKKIKYLTNVTLFYTIFPISITSFLIILLLML
jgi:hypothetical protein